MFSYIFCEGSTYLVHCVNMKKENNENNNNDQYLDQNQQQFDEVDEADRNSYEVEELILPSVRRMTTLFQDDKHEDKTLKPRRIDLNFHAGEVHICYNFLFDNLTPIFPSQNNDRAKLPAMLTVKGQNGHLFQVKGSLN